MNDEQLAYLEHEMRKILSRLPNAYSATLTLELIAAYRESSDIIKDYTANLEYVVKGCSDSASQ
jgi:hypothetical protein